MHLHDRRELVVPLGSMSRAGCRGLVLQVELMQLIRMHVLRL